jgi:phosphoserine phosphatase
LSFLPFPVTVVIRSFKEVTLEKRKALFTDIDGTLIRWVYFDLWVRICIEYGLFSKHLLIELDVKLREYKTHQIKFSEYLTVLLASTQKTGGLKGAHESAMLEVCSELAKRVHGDTHVLTRELITAAHQCGYFIAFVSGSPTLALKSLATYFPGEITCLGTDLPTDEIGRYTGELADRIVHTKGEAVKMLAKEHNLDLVRSIAIGDSSSDARMFSEVGFPLALNPNPELNVLIHNHRWPYAIEKKMVHVYAASGSGESFTESTLFDVLPEEIAKILAPRLKQLDFA